jgi:hypothetical protein
VAAFANDPACDGPDCAPGPQAILAGKPDFARIREGTEVISRERFFVAVARQAAASIALGLLALTACSPAPESPDAGAAASGWHEFRGSWNGSGRRHTIPLGGERRASLIDLTGSLLLAGPARPGVGFRAEVVALNDSATGMVGRAVWTDENGDQVFSELRGQGTATGNRITGTIIGGSGRYAGATGTYEFQWQYVLETDDGTVQGRAVGLEGRVRVGPPPVPAAQGVKP